MSSGSEARRSSQASFTCGWIGEDDLARAPRSEPTSARRRSRPARPSSRLPWYSTEQHGRRRRRPRIGPRRVKRRRLGEPRSGARSMSSTAEGPVVEDGEVGLERGAQAGEGERRASGRAWGRGSSCTSSSVNSSERAFGAGEQAGQVGLGGEQLAAGCSRRRGGRVRGKPAAMRARERARIAARPSASRPPLGPRTPLRRSSPAHGPNADRLSPGEHAAHAQELVLGLAVDDRA